MALAEAQQGISLPTIVLIDEKYDPYAAPFTLLQSLKFVSAAVPWDVRTVIQWWQKERERSRNHHPNCDSS